MVERDYHSFEEEIFTVLRKLTVEDEWPGLPVRLPAQAEPEDGQSVCIRLLQSRGQCWRQTVQPPRDFTQHRVILHAFSGRRRIGDFQFYLDEFAKNLAGVTVHVISLDVVISANGDLMNEGVREYWTMAVAQGWVVGLLAGPPCETWSRARHRILGSPGGGPRPLRSATELWGLRSLRLRELKQVVFGNTLLIFVVEIMIQLAVSGGFGALEHPAEPDEDHLPSIFKLPLVRLLKRLPGVDTVRLFQGYLGSESPKPTDLVTLNLPDLAATIKCHHTRTTLPETRSIGKDAEGNYLTSRLKEYPPAMCRALAMKFCSAAAVCHVGCTDDMSAEFLQICREMEVTHYGHTFGPDYAG